METLGCVDRHLRVIPKKIADCSALEFKLVILSQLCFSAKVWLIHSLELLTYPCVVLLGISLGCGGTTNSHSTKTTRETPWLCGPNENQKCNPNPRAVGKTQARTEVEGSAAQVGPWSERGQERETERKEKQTEAGRSWDFIPAFYTTPRTFPTLTAPVLYRAPRLKEVRLVRDFLKRSKGRSCEGQCNLVCVCMCVPGVPLRNRGLTPVQCYACLWEGTLFQPFQPKGRHPVPVSHISSLQLVVSWGLRSTCPLRVLGVFQCFFSSRSRPGTRPTHWALLQCVLPNRNTLISARASYPQIFSQHQATFTRSSKLWKPVM